MPPRAPAIRQLSASPAPALSGAAGAAAAGVGAPGAPAPPALSAADQQDILIIQDFMDTIEQIPVELTRVHSDLNELGAVLYTTLCNLERKMYQLINWVQDPARPPEQRFQLLQEVAEEAARYKLGADDKIRVAGGACDGIMAHQRHIQNLLDASTLLQPAPPSPYTQALTLAHVPVATSSRRAARAANSPFTGGAAGRGAAAMAGAGAGLDRSGAAGGGALGLDKGEGTPTKKKKSRVQQLGRDDDDGASVGGGKDKKAATKRKKVVARGGSPTDSVASATYGKPAEPIARTARQLAAAAAKARAAAARPDDSDDESDDERAGGPGGGGAGGARRGPMPAPAGGAGPDDGASREGSVLGKTGTPVPGKRRPGKRGRDDDDEGEGEADEAGAGSAGSGGGGGGGGGGGAEGEGGGAGDDDRRRVRKERAGADGDGDEQAGGGEGELDTVVYCTCRQVSYGEMIGCDDDDCEFEWFHVNCLNLDKMPEGNWICPYCAERRKKNPKGAKKPTKTKRK